MVRVALDTPLRRLFDYLPARDATFDPQPGARVRVPFGRQRLIGVVHSWAESSDVPREKLKPLLDIIDADPVIEQFYQGLMRCYTVLERRSEALSAYQRLKRMLSISLGVAPSAQTERLYQTLKKQAVSQP